MKYDNYVLICGLLLLTSCGSLCSNVIVDPALTDKATLSQLADSLTQPLIESGHNTGIVIGVLDKRGVKHVFGYGHVSKSSPEVPDGNTLFGIGSVTKSFTAMLYEKLIASGEIDSEDTVGDILPEAENFSPAARHITLRQLVDHSSGLPRQPNDLSMVSDMIHYSFTGDDIYGHIDRNKLYEFLTTFEPSQSEIGVYHYSNIGMALLGILIEAKLDQSLENLMDKHIFKPLNLHDTTYSLTPQQQARLATGYVGDSPLFLPRGSPVAPWQMTEIFKGAAGLYSSTNDLLTFAHSRLQVKNPKIISLPMDENRTLQIEEMPGAEVDSFPDGSKIIYQHGLVAGYAAYIGYEPKYGLAVVVLYNNFDWDDKIGHNLLLALIRDAKRAPKSRLDLDH